MARGRFEPRTSCRTPKHPIRLKEEIRSKILGLRSKHPNQPWTQKELIRRLRIEAEHRKVLQEVLGELVESGLLVCLKRNKFVFSNISRTVEGKLEVHRHGFGFVRPESGGRGDIYVGPRSMGGAVHGDRVLISVGESRRPKGGHPRRQKRGRVHRSDGAGGHEDHRDRTRGQVLQILERANRRVLGRLFFERTSLYLQPLDDRLMYQVRLIEKGRGNLREGSIAEAEIIVQPTRNSPALGRLSRVIATPDEKDPALKITLHKYQIPEEFSADTLAEASSIPEEVEERASAGRRNFRDWQTVTIDGESARDFDDAVSLERLPDDSYRLGVHIADVSHYVPEGSALDREAFERGNSFYFPNRSIPMLPPRLSSGVCSLKPGVDRLVFSVLMRVDAKGEILGREFTRGIIRSDARMTYTSVGKILIQHDERERHHYKDFVRLLETMGELCQILRERRRLRGAIDLDLPEAEVILDGEGAVSDVIQTERHLGHRIIEEFMLLANETVAEYLTRAGIPCLYRIHEKPEPEKIRDFAETARLFGYTLNQAQGAPRPVDYQRISDQFAARPENRFLYYLMLRSFMQARYSTENAGHFGLASREYTHFTSPIRRYADLVVHRLLGASLARSCGPISSAPTARKPGHSPIHPGDHRSSPSADDSGVEAGMLPVEPGIQAESERLLAVAEQISRQERVAVEAEREMVDHYRALLMSGRIGDEFEGLIIHVIAGGCFIQLDHPFVEGFLPVSRLEDDYYRFHHELQSLVGRSSKRMFRLGDHVRVLVERVDLDSRRILFSLSPGAGDHLTEP